MSILVEDLDPIVSPIANKKPSARIHSQRVGRVELAGGGPLLSPRLDELAILREFQYTGVRIAAMTIRDEDVAIRCHQHGRRLIERVRTVSGDSSFAKRHQDLAVRTELE